MRTKPGRIKKRKSRSTRQVEGIKIQQDNASQLAINAKIGADKPKSQPLANGKGKALPLADAENCASPHSCTTSTSQPPAQPPRM